MLPLRDAYQPAGKRLKLKIKKLMGPPSPQDGSTVQGGRAERLWGALKSRLYHLAQHLDQRGFSKGLSGSSPLAPAHAQPSPRDTSGCWLAVVEEEPQRLPQEGAAALRPRASPNLDWPWYPLL